MPTKSKDRTTKSRKSPDQPPRPPVVVVLGHIDHGKTTLLDTIRKSRVAAKEAGGITQSIGAYQVEIAARDKKQAPRKVTFIDTPGHAAFSKMRERGARVADIAVLVVAADDGVKPQTLEALAHAKAAKIPLVVVLNKMDLASSEALARVQGQLAKEGVVPEDQGGDTPIVPVSAKTGRGIPELLEMLGLVADLLELKADPQGNLEAVVIEALLSSRQGPLATLIIKRGTLRIGDRIFAADSQGKVKALTDDRGHRLSEVGPGAPAQVLGFSDVPPIGGVVGGEGTVPSGAGRHPAPPPPSGLLRAPAEDQPEIPGLNLILRTDTRGSLEAVSAALGKLEVGDKKVDLLLKGIGPIGDADVRLASSARGLVLGFNVLIVPSAQKLADDLGVGIRSFSIIYELLDVVEKLLEGAKVIEEEKKAPEAEVQAIFSLHSGDLVAGVKILNGKIKYRDRVKVIRDGEEVHSGRIRGLRIGEKDVSVVRPGQEAGVLVRPNFEFKKGDRLVVNFK
ncbi:MAG: hypothetical protein BMS9Abin34_253 [Patescibacteria group bacterium]|nr:MAG: hypothetical protein BMS9Abin34_253 [Patescibacteria group bacterium]